MSNQEKKEHKEEKKREITIPEEEYLALKEQAKDYSDRILRLQADFENTRKRMDKEKQEFAKFANEGLIVDLLNILDDLERTVATEQKQHPEVTNFVKGVEMILAHLYELLKSYGVKPIEAEGKVFDPHLHEALMQEENKDLPEHTVLEEMQKGYLMNDRVIRTTKVKVSKRSNE
ncbi:MAG: nucleotide exchange factor GrpE [Candidatus Omnitrophica bacterium]|nr:nucleotide exchange factor GrpE [Candidatus Omnitrophota bacterium]